MIHLEICDLNLSFGGLAALSNVSLHIKKGSITSIIGPNGAGKTSLMNCISGFYKPQSGRIVFEGHNITRSRTSSIAQMGMARAFQNVELFRGLNVMQNLLLARHQYLSYSLLDAVLFNSKTRRIEAENREYVEGILEFMELQPYRKQSVQSLSYGIQKRVEVARALSMSPSFLLLDEPLAGMNLQEKEDMVRALVNICRDKGLTLALIEHDIGIVLGISDMIYTLDYGKVIGSGSPDEIKKNEAVLKAYIGQ